MNDLRASLGEPIKEVKVEKKVEMVVEDNKENIPPKPNGLTRKDLEEAQLTAIMSYEKIRKARKSKKKEEMEIVRAQEQVRQTIRQTIQPRNITYGQEQYFENCF